MMNDDAKELNTNTFTNNFRVWLMLTSSLSWPGRQTRLRELSAVMSKLQIELIFIPSLLK